MYWGLVGVGIKGILDIQGMYYTGVIYGFCSRIPC